MVGDKIKEICEQRHLSITELGRLIGVEKSTIHTIINGNPTIGTLEKIAKALNVRVAAFFEEEEDKGRFTCPHCHQPITDKDFFPTIK